MKAKVDWKFVAVSALAGSIIGIVWSAFGYSPRGKR